MKAAIIVIVAIVGLLGLALVSKNSSQTATELPPNTTVYDVRTPSEYASGHADSAVLLPLASIQAGSYPNVEKDAPIAVYCRSGNRSSQAAKILKDAGYTNITDMGAYANLSKYGLSTT